LRWRHDSLIKAPGEARIDRTGRAGEVVLERQHHGCRQGRAGHVISSRVSTTDVDKVALAMLSAADRELVEHARANGGVALLSDSHPNVWDRWDNALGKAIDETGFPIRFHAIDWGF